MSHVHFTNPDVLASLRREYEQKVECDSAALDKLHIEKQQLYAEEAQWARQHLLLVEKQADGGVSSRQILPVAFVPLTGGR